MEMKYLGYALGNGRIKPLTGQVKGPVESPVPTKMQQVKSSLALPGKLSATHTPIFNNHSPFNHPSVEQGAPQGALDSLQR